jgi:putative amidase-like protein
VSIEEGRRMRRGRRGYTPRTAMALVVALVLLPLAVAADDPALVPDLRDPGTTAGDFTLASNYAPPFLRDPGTILATNPNPVSVLRSTQYNPAAAVAYADQWAHGRNPNYPDFTDNDCTNFNSQGLEAGGLPLQSVNGFLTDDRNWFHNAGIVT